MPVAKKRRAPVEGREREPRADPVKVGDTTIDIDAFLSRDYGDIAEAAEELPGLIEYISQEYQFAVEDKLNLRQELKTRAAQVFREIRHPAAWESMGFVGKITEKGVEAAVNLDEHYLVLSEKLNRMIARCGRLGIMMSNLQVKLDLVRSVEATKRKLVPDTDGMHRPRSRFESEDEDDGAHEES